MSKVGGGGEAGVVEASFDEEGIEVGHLVRARREEN